MVLNWNFRIKTNLKTLLQNFFLCKMLPNLFSVSEKEFKLLNSRMSDTYKICLWFELFLFHSKYIKQLSFEHYSYLLQYCYDFSIVQNQLVFFVLLFSVNSCVFDWQSDIWVFFSLRRCFDWHPYMTGFILFSWWFPIICLTLYLLFLLKVWFGSLKKNKKKLCTVLAGFDWRSFEKVRITKLFDF